MAYCLEFQKNVDDYIEARFDEFLTVPWTLAVDAEIISTSPYTHDIFSLFWDDASEWVSIGKTGTDELKILSNGKTPGSGGLYKENYRSELSMHFDGTLLTLYENGQTLYKAQPTETQFLYKMQRVMVGMRPNDFTDESALKLYSLTIKEAGVVTHRYESSASNGTGLTLFDTVGGADAALMGEWPADSSQWVYYESATEPVTHDVVVTPAASGAIASSMAVVPVSNPTAQNSQAITTGQALNIFQFHPTNAAKSLQIHTGQLQSIHQSMTMMVSKAQHLVNGEVTSVTVSALSDVAATPGSAICHGDVCDVSLNGVANVSAAPAMNNSISQLTSISIVHSTSGAVAQQQHTGDPVTASVFTITSINQVSGKTTHQGISSQVASLYLPTAIHSQQTVTGETVLLFPDLDKVKVSFSGYQLDFINVSPRYELINTSTTYTIEV